MTHVTHVVLVRWIQGAAETAEAEVRPAVRAFAETIPGVVSVVEGHSVSPEGLEDGFDYGFVVTFSDAAARDAYLPDPRHTAVGSVIRDAADRLVVFDV